MAATPESNPTAWHALKHAVIVCGHAVYLGGPTLPPDEAARDKHWHLQAFQAGEPPHYIAHVRAGVELAARDETALLLLSGGQTRAPHILSEAQGYHHVAAAHSFWGCGGAAARTTTEEFSRDSFDNVLFGIARFVECVGALPETVSVVSWAFKRARFLHHADSIHWPLSRFQYIAVGQPDDVDAARRGEQNTLDLFKRDTTGYGSAGGPLGDKKRARDPYSRHHGYAASCPSLRAVLEWREAAKMPAHLAPWT